MENKSIEKNYNSDENLVSESEMMKIRREKFFSLKNSGKNPFDITKFNQSHFAQKIKDDFKKSSSPCCSTTRTFRLIMCSENCTNRVCGRISSAFPC